MVNVEEKQFVSYELTASAHDLMRAYGKLEEYGALQHAIFGGLQGAAAPDTIVTIGFIHQEQAQECADLIREALGESTEEKYDNVVAINSFTTPNVTYLVGFKGGMPIDCTCPAFQHHPEKMCKHMGAAIVKQVTQESPIPSDN